MDLPDDEDGGALLLRRLREEAKLAVQLLVRGERPPGVAGLEAVGPRDRVDDDGGVPVGELQHRLDDGGLL